MELLTVLKTGGVAMWIIAVFSVLAVAVAIERALALWRFTDNARSLADAVTRSLLRGDVEDARAQAERSSSPAAEVFLAAILPTPPGKRPATDARIEAAVERQRQEANQKLRARLWILGTIGATAPFIGLFGTVVGIMNAFHDMAHTGQGGFAVVSAGISEALITTAAGIAVAVLAVVLYNALNTHAQKLSLQLRLLTEEYLELVKELLPGLRAAPPAGRSAGGDA
jgi:biopolymer transport protein ExbB